MAIPDYESIMLPLLKLAADGSKHHIADAVDTLAEQFQLSEEERLELLPSGRQRKFENRVHWARLYLVKAGLMDPVERGYFKITPEGQQAVKAKLEKIDRTFLSKYESFREFQDKKSTMKREDKGKSQEDEITPEEMIETGFKEISTTLAADILDQLKIISPKSFEKVVVELLLKMGYGGSLRDAGMAVGRSHDGGIDGLIKEDRLGLDVIYIQAKRWEGTVGRPVVQTFVGSLEGFRARRGIMITTSKFSPEAIEYVSSIERRIVLIDGIQLANLMIEHNLGVSTLSTYELKRIDRDYFGEE